LPKLTKPFIPRSRSEVGAPGNLVGGPLPDTGSLISGNGWSGIDVTGPASAASQSAVLNKQDGILIDNTTGYPIDCLNSHAFRYPTLELQRTTGPLRSRLKSISKKSAPADVTLLGRLRP
jgi:hypothetical protein